MPLQALSNKEIRLLDSSPLGFFRPYRVSMTKVVSFWLIYSRLAVLRLPGLPSVLLGSFGGRKNLSSLGVLNPSGVYPRSEPSILILEPLQLWAIDNPLERFFTLQRMRKDKLKKAGLPTPAEAHY